MIWTLPFYLDGKWYSIDRIQQPWKKPEILRNNRTLYRYTRPIDPHF